MLNLIWFGVEGINSSFSFEFKMTWVVPLFLKDWYHLTIWDDAWHVFFHALHDKAVYIVSNLQGCTSITQQKTEWKKKNNVRTTTPKCLYKELKVRITYNLLVSLKSQLRTLFYERSHRQIPPSSQIIHVNYPE